MVRVQVVHHQHDAFLVSIVHVDQLLDHPRPIDSGTALCHFHPAPPLQRRKQHEQMTDTAALVFVIVDTHRPRPGCTRLACLLEVLVTRLIQTHQDFLLPIGALVDFQHVFHRTHKARTALRRQAPALFQPRLEHVFLSVRRTVSVLMRSTMLHSTSWSANSLSVQLARPCGGSVQAKAIKWASA